jgi:hypothetical protein
VTGPKATTPLISSQLVGSPVVWQSLAIVALAAMVVGVAISRATDLCSSVGPAILLLTWFVAPVVAIAAIATVAVVADDRLERIVAGFVGVVLTGAWLFALVWASVGEAVQRSAC